MHRANRSFDSVLKEITRILAITSFFFVFLFFCRFILSPLVILLILTIQIVQWEKMHKVLIFQSKRGMARCFGTNTMIFMIFIQHFQHHKHCLWFSSFIFLVPSNSGLECLLLTYTCFLCLSVSIHHLLLVHLVLKHSHFMPIDIMLMMVTTQWICQHPCLGKNFQLFCTFSSMCYWAKWLPLPVLEKGETKVRI